MPGATDDENRARQRIEVLTIEQEVYIRRVRRPGIGSGGIYDRIRGVPPECDKPQAEKRKTRQNGHTHKKRHSLRVPAFSPPQANPYTRR